jgi:Ca2+-transporting ATPase
MLQNPDLATSPVKATSPLWSAQSCEAVFSKLNSSPLGLTHAEASKRLAEFGPNELQAARRISPWRILLEQLKNILILILIAATVASAFLGHAVEAIAITIIVFFAVMLGFVQEYRAERAIEALRQMAAPTANVMRDGKEAELPARDLVPGDVFLLRAGDKVPADARLFESVNLQVEEAPLTGESVPIEKHVAPISGEASIGDRKNMVHAGTAATYGRGRAVVVETGMTTEFGKIARMIQAIESGKTPLQQNLNRLGHTLARAAFVIVALIVAVGLFRGTPFIEMLIFGIALAVAVVPEALPAVVTISLALGVQRMVKRNALIRRLPAVETLGSTSVICSDKTGTLTKDQMTVRRIFVGGKMLEVSGAGYEPRGQFSCDGSVIDPPQSLKLLLQAAALASDAAVAYSASDRRWQIKGDPTEGALVVAAAKAGLEKSDLDAQFPRTGEIPFTSETKRMTTLHAAPDGGVAYSKGAPETIIGSCVREFKESGGAALDAAGKEKILEAARRMAQDALRVLAIAVKPQAAMENAERDMTFLGLVGMIDPPRPEAKTAIEKCERAGIKVVMITGDHPVTAQAVARELGILKSGRVVTGAELELMRDEELEAVVEQIDVYARVSPAHKLRVVEALQQRRHIVAMTGDGVNDAPALKKADIGVAMGITGTDVSKEAAAMTLTDDNFASIVAAVEEGRGIFDNCKKYLMFLLSANTSEIVLMAGAALLGLPMPLTAVQILYVNLATDGLPALALAVDPPERDIMLRKPRNPRSGIFTRPVLTLMIAGGLWSATVNLCLFAWALGSGYSNEQAMTMTFVSLVLVQFFMAYNFRSDRISLLYKPFANKWLNIAVAWELLPLAAVLYVPFMQAAFSTYSLQYMEWIAILIAAGAIFPVMELMKWMLRRGGFGARDHNLLA